MERLMQGDRASMVFTDPPYNIDYQGGMNDSGQNEREGIMNDKMSREDFYTFLYGAMKAAEAVTDGAFYVCMSSNELTTLQRAFEDAGGHWQSWIIWAKNTFTLGRADWQNQYEPILYGWPARITNHYFVGLRNEGNVWEDVADIRPKFENNVTTLRLGDYELELEGEIRGKVRKREQQTDLWREKKPVRSPDHPTMKPPRLVAKAVKASSRKGDVVLDPFGGSGTTLAVCEELGRSCRMMELDPKYADVIVRRWQAMTGGEPRRL